MGRTGIDTRRRFLQADLASSLAVIQQIKDIKTTTPEAAWLIELAEQLKHTLVEEPSRLPGSTQQPNTQKTDR